MKRLGAWIVVLVLELAVTSVASSTAVVSMVIVAFRGLPDAPVTQEQLLLTLDWQKSAFAWTFWGFATILGLIDLVVYFASLLEPGRLVTFSAVTSSRARARVVKLLLIGTVLCAWKTAWFTWLLEATIPQGLWVPRLAWATVAALFIAACIPLQRGSRWGLGCCLATAVALSAAVGLAVLQGTPGPVVYLSGVALTWLLLDKGIRASEALP